MTLTSVFKRIKIPQSIKIEFFNGGLLLRISDKKEEFFLKTPKLFEIKIVRECDHAERFWLFFFFKFKFLLNLAKNLKSFLVIFKKMLQQFFFGISVGFCKQVLFIGVGFKVVLGSFEALFLKLGFSHLKKMVIPKGIKVFCIKETHVLLKSSSKDLIENFVLKIQNLKKLDVYKNKGVLIKGKTLRKKKFKKK
jgi:ribosomal protein L6P/L9E